LVSQLFRLTVGVYVDSHLRRLVIIQNWSKMTYNLILTVFLLLVSSLCHGQVGTNGDNRNEEGRPINEINLTIEQNKMTLGGVKINAMTINGGIPGPTIELAEGDLAIINVTNKMDGETSVH